VQGNRLALRLDRPEHISSYDRRRCQSDRRGATTEGSMSGQVWQTRR
jgi:hypothetical protein